MTLTLQFHGSVSHLSDAALDALGAGPSMFLTRRWLRLLDALDLAPLVRGELSLRYAAVSRGGEVVALCPFFVTHSKSIHPHYSLEKFFFTGWKADLERLNPASRGWSEQAAAAASLYRALAWGSGAGAEGGVVVASPLSLRGGVLCAPGAADVAGRARSMIVEGLREVAAGEGLPLYFYGVDEGQVELREALLGASFQELFLFDDNVIDVCGAGIDDYLGRFKSDARRRLKREMARPGDVVRYERASGLGEMGAQLERFYEVTYSKYGEDHFAHPPWFWAALERHVAPQAEAVMALEGARPVGFSLLLHGGDDLWFYRVGRAEAGPAESPLYFNLAFYEPMRRAYQLGARRLWLGPGGYETKRRRGARRHPVYGYLWIPRRWSRAVLRPYLSLFSRLNRGHVAGEPHRPRVDAAP
jgi:uncharacterized protein